MLRNTFPLAMAVLVAGAVAVRAHAPADDMIASANQLLQSLTDEQKTKATFPFDADERKNWHFIPKERNGLTLKEMSDVQRSLAHVLLLSGLSIEGYQKAVTITTLEQVLFDLEGQNPIRDPMKYHVSIFGTPAAEGTWGWRFEGHHLSLNYVVQDGAVASVTPSFMATNPAEVREGPRKGTRVLAAEEDLARALVQSLSDEQKKTAVFTGEAPKDILTAAERKVGPLEPKGLRFADMTGEQQQHLKQLVREYIRRTRPHVARHEMQRIEKAGWNDVSFAWGGGLDKGQGHYYRVQGGHFLLEYANTQNDANHVHSVWRDFANDFGDDPLRKHYEEHPH